MLRRVVSSTLLAVIFMSAVNAEDSMKTYVDINAVNSSDDLRPVDGLIAAGQPNQRQLELVAQAGFQAVIDLRGENEDRGLDEAAILEELGLDYVVLPLSSPDAINMDNARLLDDILSDYNGPVLVHCGSGNRVGALLALRASLRGADDAAALAFGKSAGLTGLEPVVRKRLEE
ncbi:MAG: sulfur transferase domain-containing protein [Gammaproteobacteria bacterium]|nr:sulfur transferase domain-containing protein [Gammaproteobacteria bacterium]MDH5303001.1 sulfur transferase domain-containing protein [Gammaproteobacteria bacterium]MDH5321252.1 sulfur transferase domain-containing protein [Gammaproteobacteria bacterium]